MDYELRVVIEKVAVSSQEVVRRDTIKIYDIKAPASILDLGLRHAEQISLLSKMQNAQLAEQSVLIDLGNKCWSNPDCDWQSFPTITSIFGTNVHPDLAKLQCEQGAS